MNMQINELWLQTQDIEVAFLEPGDVVLLEISLEDPEYFYYASEKQYNALATIISVALTSHLLKIDTVEYGLMHRDRSAAYTVFHILRRKSS